MSNQVICIIEDNLPIRKLFTTLLKKSGFDVVDFGDGKSGLNWLQSNKTSLIILDILLPDINGTELLTQIKQIPGNSKLPVIAITGFASPNDKDKYLQLGFSGYISKPITTATFVDDIKSFLK